MIGKRLGCLYVYCVHLMNKSAIEMPPPSPKQSSKMKCFAMEKFHVFITRNNIWEWEPASLLYTISGGGVQSGSSELMVVAFLLLKSEFFQIAISEFLFSLCQWSNFMIPNEWANCVTFSKAIAEDGKITLINILKISPIQELPPSSSSSSGFGIWHCNLLKDEQ